MTNKKKERKKPKLPKSDEFVGRVFTEFESGAFSDSEVGTIVYPATVKDILLENYGTGHTQTVQNLFSICGAVQKSIDKGWRWYEKDGYVLPIKVYEGQVEMQKILKELEEIKKKVIKLEKFADGLG